MFGSDRQKQQKRISLFGRKRSCLKKSEVTIQGKRELEVDTLLLGNDKNNVIANKILS